MGYELRMAAFWRMMGSPFSFSMTSLPIIRGVEYKTIPTVFLSSLYHTHLSAATNTLVFICSIIDSLAPWKLCPISLPWFFSRKALLELQPFQAAAKTTITGSRNPSKFSLDRNHQESISNERMMFGARQTSDRNLHRR
jgi:hypothetical protein